MSGERPTVAHVNYSFFHSTQSFIHFSLAALKSVRPVCLTRERESPLIRADAPEWLREDLYTFPGAGTRRARLWGAGVRLRRRLTRAPGGERALRALERSVTPRLRPDADPAAFVGWAERVMRDRRVRLIHAYFGPLGWRMLELRDRLGVPLVVQLLGDDVAPELGGWWQPWIEGGRWSERLGDVFSRADLVLVEGEHLRARVIEMGCPPERVELQRIALPVARMPFRERTGHDGPPVAMFAGRFCEQKGVIEALAAVRDLHRAGERVELRLIGDDTMTDGSYAARVNAFIRDQQMEGYVRRLGFLDHGRYLEEMGRADVFLCPSVTDSRGAGEGGAPTTILEAQALGMPVVSTTHCDIPNVTVPGRSALLAPERDAGALAQALSDVLAHPGRWAAMGRAGREHVEAHHDAAREARHLERHYARLIG